MKTNKILSLLLCISLLAILLVGCRTTGGDESGNSEPDLSTVSETNENSESNDDKPVINIKLSELYVRINQGETYDLMQGITGIDDVDGDITDQIQVDSNGFDANTPGEYTILYSLVDSEGNEADTVMRIIKVRDSSVFEAPPVYLDEIEGEKLNPENPPLFGGAWYHKVVSSKDEWYGIEATITLPEVTIRRYDGDYNSELDVDPSVKNLDNPSVYLGGHAVSETDVGLSFSRALIDVDGQVLSGGCIAFRPFWRYITSENQDVGGYDAHDGEYAVSANGDNCIANYHWKYTEFYYLPGDKLRIVIYVPEPNKMQLQIEVLEKSTLPSSVEIREKYGWKDPANFKSPIFHAPGYGTGMDTEYKRVNAIDQVANEGGTAIQSETEVRNAIWHETYLYRKIDGEMYRVPMSENRRGVRNAPDPTRFTVTYDGVDSATGGEVVTIHPGYEN